ncbi:hypothetical protein AVR91_0209335 [Amycolatopsis keratiniphila subsp. keratiniphila]|uniref:Uncharacterized protein n=1 Tax=Amycolatopsis keratiniphila subsp. keratiniphila TaxID=227715 RepID=A0A1W2LZV5_9PSEU|nr:hypothetical protein AVR91_0209335 [Amycolatopsis keratiniphila subsp. keratiniphila]
MPEVLDRPGVDSLGAPLVLEPPPVVVVVVGLPVEVSGGVLGGVVGGVDFVEVGGSFVGEGFGFGPGPPPGGVTGGGGGATTLVVSFPSGPTDVTVVGGAVELDGAPGVGEPLTVIGPPGTALPGTSWTPAGATPCPPPGMPVPPAVAETPGPASSAIAAKAVATTRPLTPSTA